MNDKGFTLTELIVTIALLSVVMGISFPAIAKLQTQNQKQIYETYEKALLNGAKLYVDKYGRDLWDGISNDARCVKIKYTDLTYEDLIKPFDGMKKGEKVDENSTYVYATKIKTSVTYEVSLVIKQGSNTTHNNIKTKGNCSEVNLQG